MNSKHPKNNRPTWVITFGILGIAFSLLGIYGGAIDLMTPELIRKQKENMVNTIESKRIDEKNVTKNSKQKTNNSNSSVIDNSISEEPIWFEKWIIYNGLMKIALNVFLLTLSIYLLSLKSVALLMFYIYISLNLLFQITVFEVSSSHDSVLIFKDKIPSLLFIILNIIALSIFITRDKKPFENVKN
ncbi:hypothetical protein ND864_10100 [Leptospira levettii]|uniref:hypothetical protein n=1 Tax=Leptospira levettii TaxID=2023178 RepID=UPI00223DFDDE|nr:hypothetical protein [Leptospira levettii]MCW7466058.1 hypothetical protein [Leptospira levettii]